MGTRTDRTRRARACAAALTGWAVAGAAGAGQVCKDEWGHRYVMTQAVDARLSDFRCEPAAPPPPAPERAPSPQDAARALGLAPPAGGTPVPAAPDRAVGEPLPGVPDGRFDRLIAAAARRFDQDASLLRAIVHVESNFNPHAVSPKGAIGLMQVMPRTARAIGVDAPERTLFDPQTNLLAGARHLRQLMDRFPDRLDLAIAAYNAGEGAVLRYRGQVPPYPETQAYVRRVQARVALYSRS